jgi:hypothetical protein
VFARRHNAGTIDEHRRRLDRLRMGGVETVFMAPPDLTGPEDVLRLSALAQ